MTLTSILYASNADQPFDQASLSSLENLAYSNNLMLGVSGYLYYDNGVFIQYIEGPTEVLEELFVEIQKDKRHKVFRILTEENLSKRRFPEWSMRWLQANELSALQLENVVIDQMRIMSALGDDGPDFAKTAFRAVDSLASRQSAIHSSQ